MRVLIVYHSFTGQAAIIAEEIARALQSAGHETRSCRILLADPAERQPAPVPFKTVSRWSEASSKAKDMPILLEPAAAAGERYDLVFVLSNTWSFNPAAPVQTFIRSAEGRAVLAGTPVAIGIVCRGFWKGNLAKVTPLIEAAGGRVIGSEVFTHAGSWLGSTLTNVKYMTGKHPFRPRFGPFPLPPFGVTPEAIARARPFALAMAAKVG